ncbi:inorganic diphosphatase [symbiont of Argiope bruennichi]|uniref:inorganic diphosphatase n=1 Tax=symbiont of Argiope bruennichi TaxID=2810479 RepID=UPI003DA570E9
MKIKVINEIPKNSSVKYEYCQKEKRIVVDRILAGSEKYPTNYGFIPDTLDDDGDPLDVLIFCHQRILPNVMVEVRVVGMLEIIDDGEIDNKIISVVENDPFNKEINDIFDLKEHEKKVVKNFFENYKKLENKVVNVKNFVAKEKAVLFIEKTRKKYLDNKNNC